MNQSPRRMNRRTFLRGAAATLVLVAGGTVYRAANQGVFSTGQGPAFEAWTTWRSDPAEGPLALVRAGILAANPHNSQPWLFRVNTSSIELYADTSRNLGAVDPFLREMYLGLGAALENMLLAAKANGYNATLTLTPDGANPTYAAQIALAPGVAEGSALYEAIPNRHTNRGAYDTARPVTAETLAALQGLNSDFEHVRLIWFTTEAERQQVANLTVEATAAFIADTEQAHDSDVWFRQDWSQVQTHHDGLILDTQGLNPAIVVAGKMLPAGSSEQSNGAWLQATRDVHVATASAFGLLVARDTRDNQQRLQGGRLWQRMHLWATTEGLAMQPLNQIAERADREAQLGSEPRFQNALQALVGDSAWRGLMPFRIGYPTGLAGANPRRAVEKVLL